LNVKERQWYIKNRVEVIRRLQIEKELSEFYRFPKIVRQKLKQIDGEKKEDGLDKDEDLGNRGSPKAPA
jgi:hypothetical protein